MIVCLYENRPTEMTGVKLLILSLHRHLPGVPVHFTSVDLTPAMGHWLAQFPHVRVVEDATLRDAGWNVKPILLTRALDAGHDEAIWIDSDVLVSRDFRSYFADLSKDTLVATEEVFWGYMQGGVYRTKKWGFEVGRTFPSTVNSCFVRVTPVHRGLVGRWEALLGSAPYRQAQQQPWNTRPVHMLGDQDVLSALLSAKEFANVPVRLLRRGTEIIQNFGPAGYRISERVMNLRGPGPALIHMQGRKPWNYGRRISPTQDPKGYYEQLYLSLSPYTHASRSYREQLGEPTDWMDRRTLFSRFFCVVSAGQASLQGLPIALFDTMAKQFKRVLRISPFKKNV